MVALESALQQMQESLSKLVATSSGGPITVPETPGAVPAVPLPAKRKPALKPVRTEEARGDATTYPGLGPELWQLEFLQFTLQR